MTGKPANSRILVAAWFGDQTPFAGLGDLRVMPKLARIQLADEAILEDQALERESTGFLGTFRDLWEATMLV